MMEQAWDWRDLETKGYVVIRSFLEEEDIALLRADFTSQNANDSDEVPHDILLGGRGRIKDRIHEMLDLIRRHTKIKDDVMIWADYVSTETSNLQWHQDFETDFFTQDPFNALNF